MDSELWKQIDELYEAALRLEPADRKSFLALACAGDAALQEKLESLIAASEQADSFLEEPALSLGLAVLGLQPMSLVGQTVDRYRLVELIGSGGMGVVYLAYDPRLHRNIALKLLPTSITGDRQHVNRFMQEARADAAISHPNVAHVYEIGEDKGWHFITMEYVAGSTLRDIMKRGVLDASEALEIIAQVLKALVAAHAAGVVHRDIKPENVIIQNDGFLKVLDFGLAKLIKSDETQLGPDSPFHLSLHTQPELWMGTPYYMSPEQVRRQPVDGRTDVWSVGVMLYEMLAGERPFTGRTFSEIIVSILEQEPKPLQMLSPDVPDALRDVVMKAVSKSLDERYQSASAMLTDINRIQKQLEAGAQSSPDATPGRAGVGWRHYHRAITAKQSPPSTTVSGRIGAFFTSLTALPKKAPFSRSALRPYWRLSVVVVLLLSLLAAGLYFKPFQQREQLLKSRNFNLQFERLHLSGRIGDLVISPDGKYVATIVAQEGKQAIYITELATASELNIAPPSESGYSGLSFSPDGNYIYYLENQTETATLYRVSKLGGAQRKILSNVNTPVAFSPDGSRFAFVRFNIREDTPDLIISQADGTSEQTLARRTREHSDMFPVDMYGVGPAWSPDGKLLACPTVRFSHTPQEMNIEVLDAADGSGRRLNPRPWHDISQVRWLADGSGLIVAAAESPSAPTQLVLLSYPDGEVRRITNDANNYSRVSATADSKTFLALHVEEDSSIWRVMPGGGKQFIPLNVSHKKGVMAVAWSRGGQFIYTVDDGNSINLWARDVDGESTKQLTFDTSKNFRPTMSPDGRSIFFVSSRAGGTNLWRMEPDGTHPKRLTSGQYEDMPSVSPDGQWVFYRTGTSIRKVPVEGGTSVKLFNKSALYPVASPDGRLLAFFTNVQPDSKRWELEIADLKSQSIVRSFALPETVVPFNGLSWAPDGRGLTYLSTLSGAANLWLQPLDDGQPRQITDFKDAEILSFAWSPLGSEIACVLSVKTYTPVLIKPF
jgi:serine/threonine protein kinase/Tol biopolymer transport system component